MLRDRFDVIVIGSGAGGAPIACELAKAGKNVLVLEKGPLFRTQGEDAPYNRSDFKRDELFNSGSEKIVRIPGASNYGKPFYTSVLEPDLNDEPHMYSGLDEKRQDVTIEGYTAQAVGGGTQLYGAVSLRFAPDDFRLNTVNRDQPRPLNNDDGTALKDVLDWPFGYDDLKLYYEKAERLIGINGTSTGQAKPFNNPDEYQKPFDPNPISQWALAGIQGMGFQAYRTPVAVITEDHAPSGRKVKRDSQGNPDPVGPMTGYVNRYGDPLGYKSNTWVALLRPTIKEVGEKLELRPNCVVTHLRSSGRQVTQVFYRDAGGDHVVVTAPIVIVACSAIETVRLLMLSSEEDPEGFGKVMKYGETSGLLGRFFLTHCFGGAEIAIRDEQLPNGGGKKARRYDKSLSLDSDYATDACVDPDFLRSEGLWAGGAIYNNVSDQNLPVTFCRTHRSADLDTLWFGFTGDTEKRGDAMINWFDAEFGKRLSFSFMANQIPRHENHIRLHAVRDKWNRKVAHVIKDWHPHDGFLMGRFARVCADMLKKGIPDSTPEMIEAGSVYGNGVRIANHILGGARFGDREENSVLDPNCRVWGFDNLYVTDGSFMPTSGSANPTLTIQANAFRVADHLKTVV
jgi:choline dehydrogenase-like flavoprotein